MKYHLMCKVYTDVGGIKKLYHYCPPVRKIIHSLKLADYLHVQADNPCYNLLNTLQVNIFLPCFLSKYYSYNFFYYQNTVLPVFIKIQLFYFFYQNTFITIYHSKGWGVGLLQNTLFFVYRKCQMYISQYNSYQFRIKIQFLPVLLKTVLSSLYIKIQFFPVFIKYSSSFN